MNKVSVIVPNYNHSQYLEKRLDSIYNQTYQNFEVLILDDCSTDDSIEILKEYKNHPKTSYFILNDENSGSPFIQWNKGIELAKGDFIWIAEADDYSDPNFLKEVILPFNNDLDISISYCQSTRVNSMSKVTGNWLTHTDQFLPNIFGKDFVMDGNEFIEYYLIHKNVIPNVSAVLFRKSKLKEILPLTYAPFLKYNADWYYYIQLLCNTKLAFIAKSLNHFRYHDNSVISRAGGESGWLKIFRMELKGRKLMLDFIQKSNPNNWVKIKKQSEIGNDKLYFLTASHFLKRGKYWKANMVVLNKPFYLKKILKLTIKRNFEKWR